MHGIGFKVSDLVFSLAAIVNKKLIKTAISLLYLEV